jgi:hypothetical protein
MRPPTELASAAPLPDLVAATGLTPIAPAAILYILFSGLKVLVWPDFRRVWRTPAPRKNGGDAEIGSAADALTEYRDALGVWAMSPNP